MTELTLLSWVFETQSLFKLDIIERTQGLFVLMFTPNRWMEGLSTWDYGTRLARKTTTDSGLSPIPRRCVSIYYESPYTFYDHISGRFPHMLLTRQPRQLWECESQVVSGGGDKLLVWLSCLMDPVSGPASLSPSTNNSGGYKAGPPRGQGDHR